MYDSTFTFDGHESSEFDIIVKANRVRKIPQRRVDVYNIPGRNGDVVFGEDYFQNIEIEYDIIINGGRNQKLDVTLAEKCEMIALWLNGKMSNISHLNGIPFNRTTFSSWLTKPTLYRPLRDTFRPNGCRRAYFAGPMDIGSKLEKYGEATVTFSCDPRFFLDSGLGQYLISANHKITNPTQFPASPIFQVYDSFYRNPPSLFNMEKRTDDGGNPVILRYSHRLQIDPARTDAIFLNTGSLDIDAEIPRWTLDVGQELAISVKVSPNSVYSYYFADAATAGEIEWEEWPYDGNGDFALEKSYRHGVINIPSPSTPVLDRAGKIRTHEATEYLVFWFKGPLWAGDHATWGQLQLQKGTMLYNQDTGYEWVDPALNLWWPIEIYDHDPTGATDYYGVQYARIQNPFYFMYLDLEEKTLFNDFANERNYYDGALEVGNAETVGAHFPVLKPGDNWIVTPFLQVIMQPRWWTL